MESIMKTQKGTCYLCGCHGFTECHHCIHGTANRKLSEREGLKVWLCPDCHRNGRHAVHRDNETDLAVKRDAQEAWEKRYKETYPYENHAEEAAREAFIRMFGRSYL